MARVTLLILKLSVRAAGRGPLVCCDKFQDVLRKKDFVFSFRNQGWRLLKFLHFSDLFNKLNRLNSCLQGPSTIFGVFFS